MPLARDPLVSSCNPPGVPGADADIMTTSEDTCLRGEGPVARTLARCACGLRPLLHVAVLPRAAVAF